MKEFDFERWVQSRPVMVVLYLASVVGVLIGVDTFLLHLRLDPLADVHAYYDAGARLNAGLPLYDQPATTDDADFYRYPPLLAIAFRPLALLPFDAAAAIWMGVLVAAFAGTLVMSGLRDKWTWIVLGWLAAPFAWSLVIGQAHVLMTFLMTLASPLGIALAAQLKVFPILAGIYWLARREWRPVRALALWTVGLVALSFVLAPQATIDYIGFLGLDQVGDVENRSLYGISPILWAASVVVLGVIVWRTAHTHWGWTFAVALTVFVTPRLFMYQVSSMMAARRTPEDGSTSASTSRSDGE